jgi:hypothetical protein
MGPQTPPLPHNPSELAAIRVPLATRRVSGNLMFILYTAPIDNNFLRG